MKYAVIGTGAIGAYYGAKLAYAGNDVHFLLHSDYDFVKENGLQIDSCDGSFHLSDPNIYHSTADMPACDVVIVALKTTNNRFKAWHFGIAGNPTDELSYRLLATWQKGWGTYDNPFTYMQRNFSMLAEAEYNLNSIVKGITVKGAFALDRGSILGDNTGAQLSIIWNGKLCR